MGVVCNNHLTETCKQIISCFGLRSNDETQPQLCSLFVISKYVVTVDTCKSSSNDGAVHGCGVLSTGFSTVHVDFTYNLYILQVRIIDTAVMSTYS